MHVVFHVSKDKKFDETLAAALGRGVVARGDTFATANIAEFVRPDKKADVAVLAGVKGHSKGCFDAYLSAGRHAVILDKGYTRIRGGTLGTLYWRMSLDAFQPHAYLNRVPRPPDRWDQLDVPIETRPSQPKGTVLFCGSSQKYCNWHNLGDATGYAKSVLDRLRRLTTKELVYRPKPSWGDAVPIAGYRYSDHEQKYVVELAEAAVVVTFGSNAAFEAVLRGVPALVLGDGIARSLARNRLDEVDDLLYPEPLAIHQLAANVAYCQYTLDEMADGTAWDYLKAEVAAIEHRKAKKARM
jgi:hypothetical protein